MPKAKTVSEEIEEKIEEIEEEQDAEWEAIASDLFDIEEDHARAEASKLEELERLEYRFAMGMRDAEYLAKLPYKIKITRPHSFVDENGMHRAWPAGSVVTNRAEIIMLSDRKAMFEAL